jgi:hypothetical protein
METPSGSADDGFSPRLIQILGRLRSAGRNRGFLAVALLVFVAASILGFLNLPDLQREARWPMLVGCLVIGVPATLLFNALEYVVTVRMAGRSVTVRGALEISILASAANLLPLPGSALVRTQSIRRLGGKTSRAVLSTAAAGSAWIAVAAAIAGGALFVGRGGNLAIVFLVASLGLGIASYVAVQRQVGPAAAPALMAQLLAAEVGAVAVKAARLYVVVHALGYDIGVDQAVVLTVAAVIAVAVGFLPGGLGASEVLSALVAPAVDLSAAVGAAASAVDRLITLLGLALISPAIWFARRRTLQGTDVEDLPPADTGL